MHYVIMEKTIPEHGMEVLSSIFSPKDLYFGLELCLEHGVKVS